MSDRLGRGREYVIDCVLRKTEASLDTEEKATHGTSVVHRAHPPAVAQRGVEERARHASRRARGNLTLLGVRKNEGSNGPFAKKRLIYAESAINLTSGLAGREP